MRSSHRRTYVTVALVVALILVAALAAACSAQASGDMAGSAAPSADAATGSGPANPGDASPAGKAASGADYKRVLRILAYMNAHPPTDPVVVLLGGSAARESTVSDASWRAQIKAAPNNGPAVEAWNLGSSNRTMAQNVAIVNALPKVPTIVFIGINLGSFTSSDTRIPTLALPPAPSTPPTQKQPHQYSAADVLSTAKKRALLQSWLGERYPVYRRNFSTSAGVLETLIKACKARGFYPVLFELPRNTAIVGGKLNAPVAKFRDKCTVLAKKYTVPYVSFISTAKVPNSSFYDLWHLVEPGRAKWQALLSAKTARILNSADFSGGGS
jgi:hypothetical protein